MVYSTLLLPAICFGYI